MGWIIGGWISWWWIIIWRILGLIIIKDEGYWVYRNRIKNRWGQFRLN
jgi:hypothetical protein